MVICIPFCTPLTKFLKTGLALERKKIKNHKIIIKCTQIPPGWFMAVHLTYLVVLAIFPIILYIYYALENSHSTIEERNRYNWIQAKKRHQSHQKDYLKWVQNPNNLNNVLAPSPNIVVKYYGAHNFFYELFSVRHTMLCMFHVLLIRSWVMGVRCMYFDGSDVGFSKGYWGVGKCKLNQFLPTVSATLVNSCCKFVLALIV